MADHTKASALLLSERLLRGLVDRAPDFHLEFEMELLETLERCEATLRRTVELPPRVERCTDVAEAWPTQLVMDAHRAHAHLLLLGASDHLLPRRFSLSNPLEAVLRNAACDVAVFRAASPGA